MASFLDRPKSCLRRYTRPSWHAVELYTILAGTCADAVPLVALPAVLHPYDDDLGWDYDRVFVDEADVNGHFGHIYKGYGNDPDVGCVVCCRPDQHVGFVGSLDR